MSIQNRRQLENTRNKLKLLEDHCAALELTAPTKSTNRDITVRSLKKLMNQMREEIARFECRASVRSDVH
jgi:hypothetical protein